MSALVSAPVTPAVAELLHAMQAEAIAAADQARAEGYEQARRDLNLPAKIAAVVLPLPERFHSQTYYEHHGYRTVVCRARDYGAEINLQTNYRGDPDYPHSFTRPGIWYGTEEHLDVNGKRWKTSAPLHVMDDFGSLVPVGADL